MERWVAVPGFEGFYEVSDHGCIRNIARGKRRQPGHVLTPGTCRGYHHVNLSGPRRLSRAIHRLVMEAFVGPCPEGYQVDHINRDRTDNRLENLRYLLRSENARQGVRSGDEAPRRSLTSDQVLLMRHDTKTSHTEFAVRFGVHRSTVGLARTGVTWKELPS